MITIIMTNIILTECIRKKLKSKLAVEVLYTFIYCFLLVDNDYITFVTLSILYIVKYYFDLRFKEIMNLKKDYKYTESNLFTTKVKFHFFTYVYQYKVFSWKDDFMFKFSKAVSIKKMIKELKQK